MYYSSFFNLNTQFSPRSYLEELQTGKREINTLLVDVMERRVAVTSDEFAHRIEAIAITLRGWIGWYGLYDTSTYFWREWHGTDSTLKDSTNEWEIKRDAVTMEAFSQFIKALVKQEIHKSLSSVVRDAFITALSTNIKAGYKQKTLDKNTLQEWIKSACESIAVFVSSLCRLCIALEKESIEVSFGT